MKRGTKVLAAGAAVAAGPSGLRRFLGLVLVVVLIVGLGLAALMALGVWSASQSEDSAALPCPPDAVALVFTPRDTPAEVQRAVSSALKGAGRTVTTGGWGAGQERDLVVIWSPGSEARVSGGMGPTKVTFGAAPSAAEVATLLGDRLAPCAVATPTPPKAEEPADSSPEGSERFSWPWTGGITPAAVVGLAVALWWVAGPNAVRAAALAAWPLRLLWRRWQRATYRRRLARGWAPAEWPQPIPAGQRWHESEEAMADRRTLRKQVAEGEPERREALREAIREERLAGTGIGPARFWRLIYRTTDPAPTKGAPEKEEVSS